MNIKNLDKANAVASQMLEVKDDIQTLKNIREEVEGSEVVFISTQLKENYLNIHRITALNCLAEEQVILERDLKTLEKEFYAL